MSAPFLATEAQAERAIAQLKRAIEAAENGNQAGENAVVIAAAFLGAQGIETAPKDGTQILVPVGHGLLNVVSWWDGGWREGANGLRLANEPTQWFSLDAARSQVSA